MAGYLFPDKRLLHQLNIDRQREERAIQDKQAIENSLNKFCYLITRMTKEELLLVKGMVERKLVSVVEMDVFWVLMLKRVEQTLEKRH